MAHIKRLDDLKDKDDEKKEKDSNTWYTGGAQGGGSGMAVQAPEAEKKKNMVKEVFDKAQEHGAVAKHDEKEPDRVKFQGAGHSLAGAEVKGADAAQQTPRVVLTFYKDAFTIDDGDPRYYTDAANQAFLDAVNTGRIPRELQLQFGDEIDVELLEKQGEEWRPQPKKFKAFTSEGHSLSGAPQPSAASAVRVQAGRLIQLDPSAPATTIQVRTADGQRLIVKLNHTHTVGDLRAHLEASKPCGKVFELRAMGPPPVLLTNDAATVKDAGILNASIVQRIL